MALRDISNIDYIATLDNEDGAFMSLIILDEEPWGEPEHIMFLINKVKFYVDSIATCSPQVQQFKNEVSGEHTRPMIELVCVHDPDEEGLECIEEIRSRLSDRNIAFNMKTFNTMELEA